MQRVILLFSWLTNMITEVPWWWRPADCNEHSSTVSMPLNAAAESAAAPSNLKQEKRGLFLCHKIDNWRCSTASNDDIKVKLDSVPVGGATRGQGV